MWIVPYKPVTNPLGPLHLPNAFISWCQGAEAGDGADAGWSLSGVFPSWLLGVEALFLGEHYQTFACSQTSDAFWDAENIFSKTLNVFRVRRWSGSEPSPGLPRCRARQTPH